MFDGAGRGMQLIISQVSDKKRKNQYLNKDEAFELGKRYGRHITEVPRLQSWSALLYTGVILLG